jgi:hypothetical protein
MQAAAVNGAGDVQKPHQQQQPVVVGAPPPPAAAVVPPHWVAMPFAPPPGAAAMVMQPHQMAPPPPQFAAAHFLPFHAVAPPPPRAPPVPAVALGSPAPHQAGHEDNKTVWVGDLHYWMDENYLHSCFGYTGEVSTDARAPSQAQILPTAVLIFPSQLAPRKNETKKDVSFAPAHESFSLLLT